MPPFTVTTDLEKIDLRLVHDWLSTDAFWAIGRPFETVETAARNSVNFAALDAEGRQLGYARVVTDHATFAWLCDVYVTPEARGLGLGLLLAHTVVDHFAPLHLKRMMLSTLDAHGLYAKVGFERLPEPDSMMIRA